MTRGELITRVRAELANPTSSLYSTDEVGGWLYEAQTRFANETHWFRFGHNMGVTAATAQYDLPSTSSYRTLFIDEVWHNDLKLAHTTKSRIAASTPNWRNESGTPTHWFLTGSSSIYLYPTPSTTDADALDVFGAALPPSVTAADDQYYMPHGFEDYLINYACWRGCLKDKAGEGMKAVVIYQDLWMRDLERGKQKVQEADNPEIVVVGEGALYADPHPAGSIPYWTSITAPV